MLRAAIGQICQNGMAAPDDCDAAFLTASKVWSTRVREMWRRGLRLVVVGNNPSAFSSFSWCIRFGCRKDVTSADATSGRQNEIKILKKSFEIVLILIMKRNECKWKKPVNVLGSTWIYCESKVRNKVKMTETKLVAHMKCNICLCVWVYVCVWCVLILVSIDWGETVKRVTIQSESNKF